MMYENLFTEALRKRREMDLCRKNALIVADPGEGGHFVMKTDITDIVTNTNDDVIVLDVFGEFGPELDEYGAKCYSLSPGSNVRLNPLFPEHFDASAYSNAVGSTEAASMIFDMMKAMGFAPTREMSHAAATIINNVVERVYKKYEYRTMEDVILEFLKEDDTEVKFFATTLRNLGFLSGETNIDYDNKLTVLRLDSFSSRFSTGVVIPILYHLLTVLKEKYDKTGKCTWVYFPHLDELFEKDLDGFISRFWRKARTCGIVCTGGAYKDSLRTLGLSSFIPNNNLYLLRPFQKSEEWLEVYDINAENIGSSTQLAFVLESETGTIPPCPITT